MNVLLLSNGHGEDAIGAALARQLTSAGAPVQVHAFPLVGTGGAYRQAAIPVVGVQGELPSGGFARLGLRQFWGDVKAGMAGLLGRQMKALARLRAHTDAVVAVGDALPLALGAWVARRPLAFHSTAKSDFIRPHLAAEVWLMRRWCGRVYTRDERTARSLREQGVPAEFCGNIMMDMVAPPSAGSSAPQLPAAFFPPEAPLVVLLPGSRADAYDNLVDMLAGVELLAAADEPRWAFAVALASGLDLDPLKEKAAAAGWALEEGPGQEDGGSTPAAESGPFVAARLVKGNGTVHLVRRGFSPLLHRARVCIGTAGTANEQAVGLGIPVVAFPGRGGQFTPRFLAAQKRLLGDGVLVTERRGEAIADAVGRAHADEGLRERVRAAGAERMGPPGGAYRMARSLLRHWGFSLPAAAPEAE